VKSPYRALLGLRQAEEREAETAFTQSRRHLLACEARLDAAHDRRAAWIAEHLDGGAHAGRELAAIAARIEAVERDAARELEGARRQADDDLAVMLERRQQREAVERLHDEAVAAAARAEAARVQRELDDLSGMAEARRRSP
jgi:flagellar export protein FliJ